ncbi:hypothetical protein A3A84_01630 [Candidatus Collierbacteria bacterium RIFCSPLOWO2_01_FULL_50_23]|uniref:Sporulation stage II protein D amidase enhancer LytB N-terminal domain-containing protein n=1 Tax=Candidatus Collierbacteria bacterium RIFCSPHIGHO2_01_FULL_50_25 TaxID=1817722 RepID=A0A1F5EY80_9BACT|nr:MAG: hypothetical protein A2703_02245 [Candidatus Collierbacteria bacterium RIFCSPHIGHO2_01_FULL_50_25]OGD73939.1 MAG: hypothetical protein A3A84_01630 [Candidatus Collierbacteria bacterium RIFCSPLOWO2_01_FULL_50_23]
MRRWILTFVLLLAGFSFWRVQIAAAVDCATNDVDVISECIKSLQHDLELSRKATTPLESEIKKLDSRIKSLQTSINAAVARQKALEKSIADREVKIAEHYVILAKKTEELYKKLRQRSVLAEILSKVGSGLSREIGYQSIASNFDRQLIIGFSNEILNLETDKKNLEDQKAKLAILQESLNKQAAFFKGEVAKAKAYQSDLSGKIAVLSARQQEILGEKQGTFSTSVGDVPLADDPNSRPDYDPGFRPAFAAFSFGAPHFKGMSQYGAFGRAKAGQSAEQILKAYYGDGVSIRRDYPTDTKIKVSGYGSFDLESYTKRIYEMPGSWADEGGMEALKAQAIAARSYALAYTDEGRGGSICVTQACQVFKNAEKGGKWNEAVDATRGWVMVANGKPFKSMYASTSGGFQFSYTDSYSGSSTPSLWDTPSGRGGWTGQAFEKTAGSPWFYKGWYKSGSNATCGRNNPWLNSEEMADILNAWTVLVKNNQSDDRIVPLGGCSGGNPYSMSDLRSKASGMGGGYGSVSNVSVTSYSEGGYTASVHFNTDKGGVDMSGDDFKKAFNLRAPGWISLKSRLFNIEKK